MIFFALLFLVLLLLLEWHFSESLVLLLQYIIHFVLLPAPGAVLLTVGRSYIGNDVTHSTLLDRACACSYENLPKYRSYRVSNTAPWPLAGFGGALGCRMRREWSPPPMREWHVLHIQRRPLSAINHEHLWSAQSDSDRARLAPAVVRDESSRSILIRKYLRVWY